MFPPLIVLSTNKICSIIPDVSAASLLGHVEIKQARINGMVGSRRWRYGYIYTCVCSLPCSTIKFCAKNGYAVAMFLLEFGRMVRSGFVFLYLQILVPVSRRRDV